LSDQAVGGRRILVVDDSVDSAESLAMLLGALGHEVHTAHTGAEALAAAARCRPEFILLDLSLPDISGYEVARRLRTDAAFAAVCLVGLSGFSGDVHRRHCLEAGFDQYLEKPVALEVLATILNK
jgi:CheY-like chemotaxis protein